MSFRKMFLLFCALCFAPCFISAMSYFPVGVSFKLQEFVQNYVENNSDVKAALPIRNCTDLQKGFVIFSKLLVEDDLSYLVGPLSNHLIESTKKIYSSNPSQVKAMVEANIQNFDQPQQDLLNKLLTEISAKIRITQERYENCAVIMFACVLALVVFMLVNPVVVLGENPKKIDELNSFADWVTMAFTGNGVDKSWEDLRKYFPQ